jgi:hypothetical protein
MAERSFKEEVKKLRLGAGEEFRGEGILAITKALLESGVSYVAGYQGAPISHLVDVLSDANDILKDLGVRFESSASEATAAATLAASVNYPLRGAVTFKSPVGTNVASDALANLSSGGVKGGALIIIGEDYGEGSSIMQERSHAFAMKSQVWLLDPRPNLPCIVRAVKKGFELSEASNTPVMLEVRIRACHVYGRFTAQDNVRPAFTLKDALEAPVRDVNRIPLPPAVYLHEQEKIGQRWPAAVSFIKEHALNEFFDGDLSDIGIVMQGGIYNTVLRALELMGLADALGRSRVPLYVMNVTYPLVRQARDPGRGGGRAGLHRAGGQHHLAPRRHPDPHRGQERAADGRRIYRRGHARGAGQVRARLASRHARRFAASLALERGECAARRRGEGHRGAGASAPARLLHRLSGAADLHRHEARRARAWHPPCQLRHRLPPVLDPAAVQYRRDHDGLRPRRGGRIRLQRGGRQARHRHPRRRRLLA